MVTVFTGTAIVDIGFRIDEGLKTPFYWCNKILRARPVATTGEIPGAHQGDRQQYDKETDAATRDAQHGLHPSRHLHVHRLLRLPVRV